MLYFKSFGQFDTPDEIIDSRLDEKIDSLDGLRTFLTLRIFENPEYYQPDILLSSYVRS
jgi:hypothetical protein